MSVTTTYKQNDTLPEYTATLVKKSHDGIVTPIDLSGSSVKFLMKSITKAPQTVIDNAAELVEASAGKVKYVWESGDLQTHGSYSVEWEITFGDGKILTVPSVGYDKIVVLSDLN